MRIVCVFVVILKLWDEVLSMGGAREMRALHRSLFTDDYNPAVRPSLNYSYATNITMQLVMLTVMALETKQQLLHLKAYVRISWRDELLLWNPEDHGGIEDLLLPQAHIWKPDIYLVNTASEEVDYLGGDKVLVALTSDGNVKWEPGFTVKTSCQVDVSKYPCDQTVCPIAISAWMSDNKTVKLLTFSDPVTLKYMVANGEFVITAAGAELVTDDYGITGKHYELIKFKLRLARRPLYVMMSIILPITILAVLCVVSFVMPPEEPEKVTVSITVLLSFTVFLTVIDSSIPQNSEPLSLLVIYVTALVGQSFLGVVGNVVVVVLSGWDENEERNLKIGCYSCCWGCGRRENFSHDHDLESINDEKNPCTTFDLDPNNCNLERTRSSSRKRRRHSNVTSSPQTQLRIQCDHESGNISSRAPRSRSNSRAHRLNNALLKINCVLLGLICIVEALVFL